MIRQHELTDEQFDKIKDFLPGSENSVGVTAQDNRLFVNAVIWVFKTRAPWRDLPERFGKWSSVHRRFSRWSSSKFVKIVKKGFKCKKEGSDSSASIIKYSEEVILRLELSFKEIPPIKEL
mgnify:CR=1 FL=1